jgi:predicted glutamine amidotransferase
VPSNEELSRTLGELVPSLAAHGTFNMLLSNGQALWAHASTSLHWLQREHPFRAAALRDEDLQVDFAQQTTPQDRVAVIATDPLTRDEPWHALAPGALMAFVDGRPQLQS